MDYEEMLWQKVLSELRVIRAEQVKQGKELARLRVLAGVAGSIGGFLAASIPAWLRKLG